MRPHVLLVDDDEEIRAMLASTLTFSGFQTSLADGALEALEAISSDPPDVIVLDVMMPVMDGFELAHLIRDRDARVPIIFLSARDGVDDRVRGLRLGGDDYLVKPFNAIELIARIEAILRRREVQDAEPVTENVLQVGTLRLDADRHLVSRADHAIELSPTEFRLLELLMRNAGRVLSKSVILQEIWMYDFGGDANVVERFVSSLRRKIDGDQPSMIRTVRGLRIPHRRSGDAVDVRSIRGRLTLSLSLLVVVIVLGFASIGAFAVPSLLLQRDTDRLNAAAERVLTSLRLSGGVEIDSTALQNFVANEIGVVLLAGDETVAFSGLPPEDVPHIVAGAGPEARQLSGRYLADRIDVQGLGLTYADAGKTPEVTSVVLSMRTSARDLTTALVVTALVIVAIATTAALIAVAAIVVGRGLRPLGDMAEHAERIANGDRTLRLPVADAGDPAIARMAQTVNTAFDAQEDAENRMRAFVADASHELRTPLTAAHGWVELYLRGGLQDKSQRDEAMLRVERQLQRLRELTDELSLLARTDAGRPLDSTEVDLGALARDVVHDARVVYPSRTVEISVEGHPVVLGDAPRLAQVLRNLIGNALQHTNAAVDVKVIAGDGRHVVRVHDFGAGIPSEALPHIFERFWRGDSARAATGGSGLGLAIVQALVAAHDGTIRVTSTPGSGTTFEVSLAAHTPRTAP